MGNITSLGHQKGSTLSPCTCFDWCVHSAISPVGVFLWRMFVLLIWWVFCIVDLFITIGGTLFRIAGTIYPFLVFFLAALLITWVIWFGYPIISPYICEIVVPLLNVFIELWMFSFYVTLTLWNLLVDIWNAAVQLIGMILYILMEVVLKILEEIINILGDIDIMSLLDPLMDIINALMQILTEILNVIVQVGKPILEAYARYVGFIMMIFFKIVDIVIKILMWIEKLYAMLSPAMWILKAIMAMFGSNSSSNNFMARAALSLEQSSSNTDTVLKTVFGNAANEASRWWSNERYVEVSTRELEHINQHFRQHPPDSYRIFWATQRPYAQGLRYSAESDQYMDHTTLEDDQINAEHGIRHLLSVATERKLMSDQEYAEFTKSPVEFQEYWDCYHGRTESCKKQDPHEWYMERWDDHEERRLGILRTVTRRLHQAGALPKPEPLKRHYEGELHKKVRCQSVLCGGEGVALDHPILTMRKLLWERDEKRRQEELFQKPQNRTEQERVNIHLAAWAWGLNRGREKLFEEHLQRPMMWGILAQTARQITGFESVRHMVEHLRANYGNSDNALFQKACYWTDWAPLRSVVDQDPERDSRPYCSDFMRKTGATLTTMPHPTIPGRRLSSITLQPSKQPMHRALMSHVLDDTKQLYVDDRLRVHAYQNGWMPHLTEPVRTATMRKLHDSQIFGIVLPTPPFNSSGVKDDLVSRHDALEGSKENPDANLPLFTLLTATNCQSSTPRNPLCLPQFPTAWLQNKVEIVYPADACLGNDDFCQPLYCIPPRDLLDPAAWISWCHIENGWTSIKLVFGAFFFILTDTMSLLGVNYNFFAWIFTPFLVLPIGSLPTFDDWICFVIYLYDIVLDAFLIWLFCILIMPFIDWFFRCVSTFLAIYDMFIASNEARRERMKETGPLFRQAAYDSDLNPGARYFNDPRFFTQSWDGSRGANNLHLGAPPHNPQQFATYPDAANHWAPTAGRYNRSSMTPWMGQTSYERANAVSPYQGSPTDHLTLPWNRLGEEPLISGAIGADVPAAPGTEPAPPPMDAEALARELERQRTLQELQELERTLLSAAETFGIWEWQVTNDQLLLFERWNHWLLHSFQETFWWMLQYTLHNAKKRKIHLWYSPHQGEFRRGFTQYTQDDLSRALRPNEQPVVSPAPMRNMNV
jgi:hypothetical protein